MKLYFDASLWDWVYLAEDDCIYDDWFWMSWSDLLGE
jgi:hypothetical protein